MREMTPKEVLKLRNSHPYESLLAIVVGVPSKPFYLSIDKFSVPSKHSQLTPIGLVFNVGKLECGISYTSIAEAARCFKKDHDSQYFNLFRIKSALETIERENMSVKFKGKYDTSLNIFEVDYTKTFPYIEEAIKKWRKKQEECIRLFKESRSLRRSS